MQSIAQEPASGCRRADSVLAALNDSGVTDNAVRKDDFAAMLEESTAAVEPDDKVSGTMARKTRDAKQAGEAPVRDDAIDDTPNIGEEVAQTGTDEAEVAAASAAEESEANDAEEDGELSLAEGVGESIQSNEAVDSLTSHVAEDAQGVNASVAEATDDGALPQAMTGSAPEVTGEVTSNEAAAPVPMVATPEAEEQNAEVNRPVEEVAADTVGSAAQAQPLAEAHEASVQVATTANDGRESEQTDSRSDTASAPGETAVDKTASVRAPVTEVEQADGKQIPAEAAPKAEALAASGQDGVAAAARTISGEERAEKTSDEEKPAANLDQAPRLAEAVGDPVELRRQMAQVRMQTGIGEGERKHARAGQGNPIEAAAGALRPESAQRVTGQEGVAEARREPLNTTRFIEDIISQARMLSKPDGSTEMRLRLDPPELGSVLMRLSLNNNKLDVQLEVDSPAVRQMVGDTLQRIKEILSDDGVDLEKFDIGLRRQPNQGAGGNGRQGSSRREEGADSNATADDRVADPHADALRRATLSAAGMIDFTA